MAWRSSNSFSMDLAASLQGDGAFVKWQPNGAGEVACVNPTMRS